MRQPDERYQDAIDHALDGEVSYAALDAQDQLAVSRLRSLASRAAAYESTAFSHRNQVQRQFNIAQGSSKHQRPRGLQFLDQNSRLASVSMLAIIVALGILVTLVWSNEPRSDEQPTLGVAQIGNASSASCKNNPYSNPYPKIYMQSMSMFREPSYWIAAPNAPEQAVQVMKRSDLRLEGEPVDRDTYLAVQNVFQNRLACRNAFGPDWANAIVSGGDPQTASSSSRPEILNQWTIFPPTILKMSRLSPWAIGVLISKDLYGAGVSEYDVYNLQNNEWEFVDYTFVADDRIVNQSSDSDLPTSARVILGFQWPNELVLAATEESSLLIINNTEEAIAFRCTELDLWDYLEPGVSVTVPVTGPPGSYKVELIYARSITFTISAMLTLRSTGPSATPVS